MAKISLNKITPIKSLESKFIEINGEKIEVIQYLPTTEKAELLQNILTDVLDDQGISSGLREQIFIGLYIIKYYTNINLTDTMLTNGAKTYDLLVLNKILPAVIEAIPSDEYNLMVDIIYDSLHIMQQYHTSLAGMFKDVTANQNTETKTVEELLNDLSSLGENSLLNDVLKKMG